MVLDFSHLVFEAFVSVGKKDDTLTATKGSLRVHSSHRDVLDPQNRLHCNPRFVAVSTLLSHRMRASLHELHRQTTFPQTHTSGTHQASTC